LNTLKYLFMIFVYGAYGYTGSLLCRMLSEEGIDFIISGRNKEKLENLKRELEGFGSRTQGKSSKIDVLPAGIDELEKLTPSCKISLVVNTAGPFTLTGEKVVEFALKNGASYIDCSGEANHLLHVREKYGKNFQEKGLFLSVGVAWETVAGEFSVRKLIDKLGIENVKKIYLVYLADFSMTPGTIQSSLHIIKNGSIMWRKGKILRGKPGEIKFEFELGGKKFMGLNISSADIINVPLSLGEFGEKIDFDVLFATSLRRAKAFSLFLKFLDFVLKSELALRFLSNLLDRFPPPNEEKSRASAISFALDESGKVIDSYSLATKKPYFITAKILKHACMEFISGKTKGKKGYIPPTSLFSFQEDVFQS